MRTALPCLGLLLAALVAPAASAGGADCGLIRDHDRRRACFAESGRKPSECGLIRDSDERRLCRSRAERRR